MFQLVQMLQSCYLARLPLLLVWCRLGRLACRAAWGGLLAMPLLVALLCSGAVHTTRMPAGPRSACSPAGSAELWDLILYGRSSQAISPHVTLPRPQIVELVRLLACSEEGERSSAPGAQARNSGATAGPCGANGSSSSNGRCDQVEVQVWPPQPHPMLTQQQ